MKELKASIKAHGLMQNPVVKLVGAKWEMIAGSRRIQALKELQKEGAIDKAYNVTCNVYEGENAAELSIAENVVREDMNPADEYEAFAALLSDKKMTMNDVALRFGCDAKHVERRMRLGRLAPDIIK